MGPFDAKHYSAGAAIVLMGFAALAGAFETPLDRRTLEEAVAIGQSRIDTIRTRFHAPYRIRVDAPPVDFVDVLTPFRRIVLGAESRARAGNQGYGLRQAQIDASAQEVVLHVELTFHPLNTFIGVPGYEVLLATGTTIVQPASIARVPRFGPRLEGAPLATTPNSPVLPGGGQPLTGGALIARFTTTQLNSTGAYDLHVMEGKTVLAKSRVDFARLR